MLEYYGYEVVEAVNGEEGVRMALAELPGLILMDIHMPVMMEKIMAREGKPAEEESS